MSKVIDSTNLGHLISKMKAAFWPKSDTVEIGLDNVPTANSNNLVKSGGVYSSIAALDSKIGDLSVSLLVEQLKSHFSGISGSETAVKNFLKALGADGSNGIWDKIKYLYMPCLGVSSDGDNALYDIITGSIYPKTDAVTTPTIYDKRGVLPTTKGSTIGTVAISGITSANQSLFASFCRHPSQSITNSSGIQVQLGSLCVKWEKEIMVCVLIDNSANVNLTKATGFETPNWLVVSCLENGNRKFICADSNTTSSALDASLAAPTTAHLAKGYVCTSIFGICDGLTASEAATVSSAISAFTTAYGIQNS